MKNWLHIFGSIGIAAATAALPVVQGIIASHPIVTTSFGVAYAILGSLLKSPLPTQQ